jgi:hypothetical protein
LPFSQLARISHTRDAECGNWIVNATLRATRGCVVGYSEPVIPPPEE